MHHPYDATVQSETMERHDGRNKTAFYFQTAAQRIRQSGGQAQKQTGLPGRLSRTWSGRVQAGPQSDF